MQAGAELCQAQASVGLPTGATVELNYWIQDLGYQVSLISLTQRSLVEPWAELVNAFI